jgi:hypothetical protein
MEAFVEFSEEVGSRKCQSKPPSVTTAPPMKSPPPTNIMVRPVFPSFAVLSEHPLLLGQLVRASLYLP